MTKGVNTGAMWTEAQDASCAADLVPIQAGAQHSSRNNSMKIWTDTWGLQIYGEETYTADEDAVGDVRLEA